MNNKTYKNYLIGYVVGVVYLDGNEWLYNKNKNWKKPEEDPKLFNTIDEAIIWGKKLKTDLPLFVRAYWCETSYPEKHNVLREMQEGDYGRIMI